MLCILESGGIPLCILAWGGGVSLPLWIPVLPPQPYPCIGGLDAVHPCLGRGPLSLRRFSRWRESRTPQLWWRFLPMHGVGVSGCLHLPSGRSPRALSMGGSRSLCIRTWSMCGGVRPFCTLHGRGGAVTLHFCMEREPVRFAPLRGREGPSLYIPAARLYQCFLFAHGGGGSTA